MVRFTIFVTRLNHLSQVCLKSGHVRIVWGPKIENNLRSRSSQYSSIGSTASEEISVWALHASKKMLMHLNQMPTEMLHDSGISESVMYPKIRKWMHMYPKIPHNASMQQQYSRLPIWLQYTGVKDQTLGKYFINVYPFKHKLMLPVTMVEDDDDITFAIGD